MPKSKAANPTDVYVGQRIRTARMMINMSQEKLGDALGLTFQQVQKYEKGTNRVSASKLQSMANIFGIAPSFFFDGGPLANGGVTGSKELAPEARFADVLTTRDGVALNKAFGKLDKKLRRHVVGLVEAMVRSTRAARKAA